jgi:hypothetical protein
MFWADNYTTRDQYRDRLTVNMVHSRHWTMVRTGSKLRSDGPGSALLSGPLFGIQFLWIYGHQHQLLPSQPPRGAHR